MTKTPYPYQKFDPSGGSVSAAPSPDWEEVTDLDRIEFQLKEISAATVEYGSDGIPCGYGPPAHSAEEMVDKALTCLALLDRHRAALAAMRPAPKLTEEDRARVEEIRAQTSVDADLILKGAMPSQKNRIEAHEHRAFLLSLIDKLANQEPTDGRNT